MKSRLYRNSKHNYTMWLCDIDNYKILHREDGPAVCYDNGNLMWFYYGKRHRLDGPAIIMKNIVLFYINDQKYSEEEYWRTIKLKAFV